MKRNQSVSYTHLDVYKRQDVFSAASIAQKYNCMLTRLDYRQEQGLMSSIPLGENLIQLQRGLTTSSTCLLYTSPQPQQELTNTMNAMQPPQSVEEVKATLETTEKGGVRQSIRNCLTVFQRDPVLAGAIAYNILTDRKDIIKPIGFHRESTALTDTDMKYLLLYLEETYGLTSEKKIETAIGIVANENKIQSRYSSSIQR